MKEVKLQKYQAYKDSGVEWLGEIPEHWEVKSLKSILIERKENNNPIKTTEILSLSMHLGVTKYSDKGRGGNKSKEDLTAYKIARPNDIVLNSMNVIVGSVGLCKYFGAISPVYYALYARDSTIDINYYDDLFQNPSFQMSLFPLGNGILIKKSETSEKLNTIRLKIPISKLNSVLIPYPPIVEQTAIANFLDNKTALIDKAIALKVKQIELLKERRQIVIHSAVTRGIGSLSEAETPDVKLKDSGVEWIGEIPEHWEVKALKFCTKIFRGKFTHRPRNDERLYDGNYPFFQTGDVARAGKYLSEYRQTLNDFGLRVSTLFPKGTIVITIAANIGDISILDIDACFPDSIVGFEPMDFIDRDFLYNSLLVMKEQFMSSTIKNTQMNLNVDRIGINSITIPSIKEQLAINEYIEIATSKISTAITLKEKEIEKLKEYKSVLINEAVSGKIKVA